MSPLAPPIASHPGGGGPTGGSPFAWGNGFKGALGGGWWSGSVFPFMESVPLENIVQHAHVDAGLICLNASGDITYNGVDYTGTSGLGRFAIPGRFVLLPTRITGGVPLYPAFNWPKAFLPGAINFHLAGPRGPEVGGTTLDPANTRILAVTGQSGKGYALRADGKALAWGNNGFGNLANGFLGSTVIENIQQPAKVNNFEEAGVFVPQYAPHFALCAFNSALAAVSGFTGYEFGGLSAREGGGGSWALGPDYLGEKSGAVSLNFLESAEPQLKSIVATGDLTINLEGWNTHKHSQVMLYIRQDGAGGHNISLPQVKWGSEGPPALNAKTAAEQDPNVPWQQAINTAPYAHTIIALHFDGAGNVYGGRVRPLTGVKAIAAGHLHALYLLENGELFYSGLPAGEVESVLAQPLVSMKGVSGPSTSQKAIAISTGSQMGIALMSGTGPHGSGEVRTFGHNGGHNSEGLAGTGELEGPAGAHASNPGLTHVTAVAAEESHLAVVKDDGTAWAWGVNIDGEVCNTTAATPGTPCPSPVRMEGLPDPTSNPAVAISVGGEPLTGEGVIGNPTNIVLLRDGSVRTGGGNSEGQLADLTTTNRHKLIEPAGVTASHVIAISAGCGTGMSLIDSVLKPRALTVEAIPEGTQAEWREGKGALKLVWRLLGLPGERRPGAGWRVKWRRSALRPQSAEELEKEYLPVEQLKENEQNSATVANAANVSYSGNGITISSTGDGRTYTATIPVSTLPVPNPTTSTSNFMECKVQETSPQVVYRTFGTPIYPGLTLTYGLGSEGETHLIGVAWTHNQGEEEPGYVVRWRRVEEYIPKGVLAEREGITVLGTLAVATLTCKTEREAKNLTAGMTLTDAAGAIVAGTKLLKRTGAKWTLSENVKEPVNTFENVTGKITAAEAEAQKVKESFNEGLPQPAAPTWGGSAVWGSSSWGTDSYVIHLAPFVTHGEPATLTSEPVEVLVEGDYQGAFQTRIVQEVGPAS